MGIYVVIAGILGFFPGVAYALILMESWMIFSIAHSHNFDNVQDIIWYCGVSAVLSAALKSVAHVFHLMPLVGQIGNSVVAMLYVVALYSVAESHYSHVAQTGQLLEGFLHLLLS